MANLAKFRSMADALGRRAGVTQVKVYVGQPRKEQKLFLVYDRIKYEFTIRWEDGVELSPKIANKIFPYALTALASVWQSEEKRIKEAWKQKQEYERRRKEALQQGVQT